MKKEDETFQIKENDKKNIDYTVILKLNKFVLLFRISYNFY